MIAALPWLLGLAGFTVAVVSVENASDEIQDATDSLRDVIIVGTVAYLVYRYL